MSATKIESQTATRPPSVRASHPIRNMVLQRVLLGALTVWIVTAVVFAATQLLPGDAARAVLGKTATPEQVAILQKQMGLDQPAAVQYWTWLTDILRGDFGTSLVNGDSVSSLIGPQLVNSVVLVVSAGLIGTIIGVLLGLWSAVRRGKPIDHFFSVLALTVISLPEFVVAIFVTVTFATNIFHWFPAVSSVPPGQRPWADPSLLVLPITVLVIVVVPYLFRMTRAATIEALESEYVEMARLKGLSTRQVVLRHALPNAVPPTIQAIGITLLYLAGGIVVVETIFNYPGIGQGLYSAVLNKDIPTIQFIVTMLAVFYVLVNIATDVFALMATPRRRLPR